MIPAYFLAAMWVSFLTGAFVNRPPEPQKKVAIHQHHAMKEFLDYDPMYLPR